MLESLLFLILIFTGVIFLVISLLLLVIGIVKKKPRIRNVGFGIGFIPLFCFGLIAIYYKVLLPASHENQMEDFAGIYTLTEEGYHRLQIDSTETPMPVLVLYDNGTYELDGIPQLKLKSTGTWQTGRIDGMFEFEATNGTSYAMPRGSGSTAAMSFDFYNDTKGHTNDQKVIFVKTQSSQFE